MLPEVEGFESVRYTEIRCKLRISSLRSFPYCFPSYDVFSLLLVILMQERSSVAFAPRDSQLLGGCMGHLKPTSASQLRWRPCELFLGTFAKLRKATASVVMSVSPHGTTRLLLDGFARNLIFYYFSKICRGNWSLIEVSQKKKKPVLHMNICAHLWEYLAHFLIEWGNFSDEICR